MAEYNNNLGFEASQKSRKLWRSIIKEHTPFGEFDLPPLFKKVAPSITFFLFGVFLILILEGYATFGVALNEGVTIWIILILIIVDFAFAYFPHWKIDAAVNQCRNEKFIADKIVEFKPLDDTEDFEALRRRANAHSSNMEAEIKRMKKNQKALYSFLIISAAVKLYFFFQTYPFFDTYQAYVVIIAYVLGAVLHILCTGHVINYYVRFRRSLATDKSTFNRTRGGTNASIHDESLINSKEKLTTVASSAHNQKIIVKADGTFYFDSTGILFDEELNELISKQSTYLARISVAVYGKKLQMQKLGGVQI